MADNCLTIRTPGILLNPQLGSRNPPYAPEFIPGAVAAWKPESGIVNNGAATPKVTSWIDEIGGISMTQSNALFAPQLDKTINGVLCPRFYYDGSQQEFLNIPAITIGAQRLMAFMLDVGARPSAQEVLFSPNANGADRILLRETSSDIVRFVPSANLDSPAAPFATDLVSLILYYSSDDALWHMRINGVDVVSGARTATANFSGGVVGRYNNSTAPVQNTALAELTLASGAQSLANVQKLEGYFRRKYAPDAALAVSTTSGSATVDVTAMAAGQTPLAKGRAISGAGIPDGAYITAMGTSTGGTGTVTISAAATATATGVAAISRFLRSTHPYQTATARKLT